MRHRITIMVLGVLVAAGSVGCAVSATQVKELEKSVAQDKAELTATKASLSSMKSYVKGLETGNVPSGSQLYVTAKDITKGAQGFFPYTMPAKALIPKTKGTFTVSKVKGVAFKSRNRLTMQLFFNGKDLKYTKSVPKAYKKDISNITAALKAGVWATLSVVLVYDKAGSKIKAYATCTKVSLKKHNKSQYQSEVKKYINAKLLKKPITIPVPKIAGKTAEVLMTTANHLIFSYK